MYARVRRHPDGGVSRSGRLSIECHRVGIRTTYNDFIDIRLTVTSLRHPCLQRYIAPPTDNKGLYLHNPGNYYRLRHLVSCQCEVR